MNIVSRGGRELQDHLFRLVYKLIPNSASSIFLHKNIVSSHWFSVRFNEVLANLVNVADIMKFKEKENIKVQKFSVTSQVAIIGGGLSGLTTALELSEKGVQCVLIDQYKVGGILRRFYYSDEISSIYHYSTEKLAEYLKKKCEENGVVILENTAVFYVDHNSRIIYAGNNKGVWRIKYDKLVIATGRYELPRLIENNDLPGVVNGDGFLRIINDWKIKLGGEIIVIAPPDDPYSKYKYELILRALDENNLDYKVLNIRDLASIKPGRDKVRGVYYKEKDEEVYRDCELVVSIGKTIVSYEVPRLLGFELTDDNILSHKNGVLDKDIFIVGNLLSRGYINDIEETNKVIGEIMRILR